MAIETISTEEFAVPTTSTLDPAQDAPPCLNSASDLVELELSTPAQFKELFPSLSFDPYDLRSDSKPSNVLAFVQNAARKEIRDLVTVILPSLEQWSKRFIGDSNRTFDPNALRTWWRTFLRFMFFVAETEGDFVNKITHQHRKLSGRVREFKRFNTIQSLCKSIADRYSFAMEVVFRAADRALERFTAEPNLESLDKTFLKLKAVCQFMLDTMSLSKNLVTEAESLFDMQINRLEDSVAESLISFTRSEASVFLCIFTQWLGDERRILRWIRRHCGMRGRFCGEKWIRSYADGRGKIVSELSAHLYEPF